MPASDRGAPNLFGWQGEANAIAPGKRMLSSMAPTLLLDADGEVRAVAGARAGPRIITATWQVLSNVIDFGMNALERCMRRACISSGSPTRSRSSRVASRQTRWRSSSAAGTGCASCPTR